ncbi:MAG: D-alanyl-D-alanine carboxypeptidase family protein [Actinomycetota bacterium]
MLAFVALTSLLVGGPATEADLKDDIAKLKEEREALQQDRENKARSIDAATAEAAELAEALGVLNAAVNEQEGELAAAEQSLRDAEDRFAAANRAVLAKEAEIERLEVQVSARAISAFVDQNIGSTPVLEAVDPNRAVRMRGLVQSVTRQEVDVAEQLRVAREDLAFEERRANDAAGDAETFRATIESELRDLEAARDDQFRLTDEAEARLEAQLAEAAVMAERDREIAAEITENEEELQRQIELARRRRNPAPSTQSNPKFPTADEITQVGGFWVHIDIADDLRALLAAAEADGITFGGWGYRDHSAQIRLRRAHCGTSEWAIYQKPSSTCSPPTARPGQSQHELGKAIDFTYNGRTIGTRSSPGYQWLAANASRYGLYNLPSEPWHWSVNGR